VFEDFNEKKKHFITFMVNNKSQLFLLLIVRSILSRLLIIKWQ